MARLRDWINLGKTTFSSLRADDVTSLYKVEWPETKKALIADHRSAIDLETRGWEVYLIHHDRAQVARDGRRVRELLRYE